MARNGIKTGGRQKGTPNKSSSSLQELIASNYPDFNPILQLIEISQQKSIDLNLKASILKEVATYMYPKRKPIEYETEKTNTLPMEIFMNGLKDIRNEH